MPPLHPVPHRLCNPLSTVVSASLSYKSNGSYSGACNIRIYFNNVDAPTAPTTWNTANNKILTTNYVDWAPGAWSPGQWYTSPDLTLVLQEIVNRTGRARAGAMLALVKDNGSAEGGIRQAYSYDSAAADSVKLSLVTTIPIVGGDAYHLHTVATSAMSMTYAMSGGDSKHLRCLI